MKESGPVYLLPTGNNFIFTGRNHWLCQQPLLSKETTSRQRLMWNNAQALLSLMMLANAIVWDCLDGIQWTLRKLHSCPMMLNHRLDLEIQYCLSFRARGRDDNDLKHEDGTREDRLSELLNFLSSLFLSIGTVYWFHACAHLQLRTVLCLSNKSNCRSHFKFYGHLRTSSSKACSACHRQSKKSALWQRTCQRGKLLVLSHSPSMSRQLSKLQSMSEFVEIGLAHLSSMQGLSKIECQALQLL